MHRVFSPGALAVLALGAHASASSNVEPPIDFGQFAELTNEVHAYRATRLIDLDEFLRRKDQPNTVILDTRSRAAYEQQHIKGAVHLTLADFTDEKLAELIPDRDTTILIYCNNNIAGSPRAFPVKRVSLALNIATFINLYGSDYKNVYELGDLVAGSDPRLEFEGTLAR